MTDFIEIDFLGVETSKSGDAIAIRYCKDGVPTVHVVDGGYLETGDKLLNHIKTYYQTTRVDHVVLTHSDQDHANGLRKILEELDVGCLWMNRPWLYAAELIGQFETYNSVQALERKLRATYSALAVLEEIALRRKIPIREAFQGTSIGIFSVVAPSRSRYMDLVVSSEKTPQAVEPISMATLSAAISKAFATTTGWVRALWGEEYFPPDGTSNENEMSIVQFANFKGKKYLLTGDAGREGLTEAADFMPVLGVTLPGIKIFQVPHHGGRHNVSTEVLDRWLGPKSPSQTDAYTWNAICSSALADEHHPRKAVIRAMLHRGAHFASTEGKTVNFSDGISREGWTAIAQAPYPEEQEQ